MHFRVLFVDRRNYLLNTGSCSFKVAMSEDSGSVLAYDDSGRVNCSC